MNSVLDRPVLVLNRYWQPVHSCSVRRSLRLLCVAHAQVVQVEGDEQFQTHDLHSWVDYSSGFMGEEMVHGATIALRIPKVLVLTFYDRVPRLEVRFSRHNVFLRDKFTCQYCEKTLPEMKLNLDHVLPREKGGRTTWENIVTSCFCCNTRKANMLPHQAGMHPCIKPFAPRWQPLFGLHENGLADESWKRFLDPLKGNTQLSA